MSSVRRSSNAAALSLALVAGFALWLQVGELTNLPILQAWGLAGAAVAGVVASRVRWRPRRRWDRSITTLAVGLGSAVVIGVLFLLGGGDARPALSDEYSYLLQSQMLARGRLWQPGHPLPEFFTTFQVVAAPAYGSIYFPGTALWLLPWVAIDLYGFGGTGAHVWPGPLLAAAIAGAVLYRIVAELADDDRLGLLAAGVLLCVPAWRTAAMMPMGQAPAVMFGLLAIYCTVRWRRRGGLGWATLGGLAAVWGAFCRPVDALAFVLPASVYALTALPRVGWRRTLAGVGAACVTAVPFVALQVPFDRAMTGGAMTTPFSWYAAEHLPGTSYAGHRRIDVPPPNVTPHFQLSYRDFVRPFITERARFGTIEFLRRRAERLASGAVPHPAILVALPLAGLAWRRRGAGAAVAMLAATPIVMWLGYLPYGFYLPPYAATAAASLAGVAALVPPGARRIGGSRAVVTAAVGLGVIAYFLLGGIVPAVIAGVVTGSALLAMRGTGRGRYVAAFAAVAVLASAGLPGAGEWGGREPIDRYASGNLRQVDAALDGLAGPAVVFVTPSPDFKHKEADPVYNLGGLPPDEVPVLRAHDLGPRNLRLVRHLAEIDPARRVYHLDQRGFTLVDLGPAGDLHDAGAFDRLSAWWRERYREAVLEQDRFWNVSPPLPSTLAP